jgi:hypothetical protein
MTVHTHHVMRSRNVPVPAFLLSSVECRCTRYALQYCPFALIRLVPFIMVIHCVWTLALLSINLSLSV